MDLKIQIKNTLTFSNIIILLLLCMATMNVINRYFYFIFIAFAWFCIKKDRKIHVSIVAMFSLFMLALAWLLFSTDSLLSPLSMLKPFTYLLCYVMGFSLLNDDPNFSRKLISYNLFYLLITVIAIGPFIHYLLNWYINASVSTALDRNTVDIWTNQVFSATGQASLACIPLALTVAFIFSNNNKIIKVISVLSIILILGYNLVLSGRTLFVLLLIAIVGAFGHLLLTRKKGKMKMLIIFLAVVVLLVFIYQANIFGIRNYVESSPIYERFFGENSQTDLDEDGRMENKIHFLQNMSKYPFGGGHLHDQTGYAHDIFLDTYDQGSVFALIAIVIFILNSLKNLILCLKEETLPFMFRQIVFCLYLILYVEFMLEPILIGMPWMFASFCLIDGYVSRILSEKKREIKYENC